MTARGRRSRRVKAVVRVAIYVRISKDEYGTMLGVQRQEAEALQLLDAEYGPDGWTLVRVYCDNNISAWSGARRPEYEQLLADARTGLIDLVAVWSAERLYRLVKSLTEVIDAFGIDPAEGVELMAVTGSYYDLSTADGRYYAHMDAARAQHDSDRKSEAIKAQRRQAVEAGWPNSRPTFGYDRECFGRKRGATLHPVDRQVETLRWIASLILDEEEPASQAAAAQAANAAGKLRNGVPWTGSTVRGSLLTPTVAGLIENDEGELVPGNWEPIFDRPTWESIKTELNDPQRRRRRAPTHYWLRGTLVDEWHRELLGGRLGSDRKGEPKGYSRRAYRTPWPAEGASTSIDADAVEGLLMDLVGEFVHLVRWEQGDGLEPSPAALEVVRIEGRMAALGVERERDKLTAGEYRARRGELLAQLNQAKAAVPSGRRVVASESPVELARRWPLTEDDGGLSAARKQAAVRRALGLVVVKRGKGGRYATQPEQLLGRLVIADGPLAAAMSAGRPASRGRPRGGSSARATRSPRPTGGAQHDGVRP